MDNNYATSWVLRRREQYEVVELLSEDDYKDVPKLEEVNNTMPSNLEIADPVKDSIDINKLIRWGSSYGHSEIVKLLLKDKTFETRKSELNDIKERFKYLSNYKVFINCK